MISFVRGTLSEVLESSIVVEAGGLGLEISVPLILMDQLPRIGEEVKIYTYFRVAEDAMSLYGFGSRRDLDIFRMLIGVSGIGPKGALALLSTLRTDDLMLAIATGDQKSIAKAPGIGLRTAQRLIVDLKDKIDLNDLLENGRSASPAPQAENAAAQEAAEALISLGYNPAQAARAVRSVEVTDEMDVEEILKQALKRM